MSWLPPSPPPQQDTSASVDGSIMSWTASFVNIDRDIAEEREFAAMANDNASTRSETSKRLSWTGVG